MAENPSIDQLRAFLLLADTGSVSRAAKRLGDTQPTVSRRLRDFYRRPALLCKRGNVVQLTAEGHAAVSAVRTLLRQYDHMKQYLAAKAEAPSVLTVAVGTSGSRFFLPRAMAAMRAACPDVEIQTRVVRGEERVRGVSEGRFDLAVVSHTPAQIDPNRLGLVVSELPPQELCVIASKETPEAGELRKRLAGHRIPLSKLADWPLVGLDARSGVRRQIESALRGRKLRARFCAEAGGWLGIKEYVRQGIGVGLVPLAVLSPEDLAALEARRLDRDVQVVYHVIYRAGSTDPHVAQLVEEIDSAAQRHQQDVDRTWSRIL